MFKVYHSEYSVSDSIHEEKTFKFYGKVPFLPEIMLTIEGFQSFIL